MDIMAVVLGIVTALSTGACAGAAIYYVMGRLEQKMNDLSNDVTELKTDVKRVQMTVNRHNLQFVKLRMAIRAKAPKVGDLMDHSDDSNGNGDDG